MLVLYPFCAREKEAAVRLAEWIVELGGVSDHDCLLAVHSDTDSRGVIEPLRTAFKRVAEFSVTDKMNTDRSMYVYCANMMWKRSAKHVAAMNEPMSWLWIEMDATPLPTPGAPSWLDQIEAEYKACGKPFMHHLTVTQTESHNSGLGVYPARVTKYTNRMWELANSPWDVFLSPDFMPHTHHTGLIDEIFYEEGWGGPPPTFPDEKSLRRIEPGAVLFHRCKDGSLIDRLREKRNGIKSQGEGASDGAHNAVSAGATPAPAIFKPIYTYLEDIEPGFSDPELLELFWESWGRMGWQVKMLTDADARKHPNHDLLMQSKALFAGTPLPKYIEACYRRWCAYAMVAGDGEWFCDFDVINYDFPASTAREIKHGGKVEIYSGRPTPCLIYGNQKQVEDILALFLEYAAAPHLDSPSLVESVNDQNILNYYPSRWTSRSLVAEYPGDGWEMASLVHYPHGRLYLPGERGAKIKTLRSILPPTKYAVDEEMRRLRARIQELEQQLAGDFIPLTPHAEMVCDAVPDYVYERLIADGNKKPAKSNYKRGKSMKLKPARTPEQIQLAKERMAKARAGKRKLSGVA